MAHFLKKLQLLVGQSYHFSRQRHTSRRRLCSDFLARKFSTRGQFRQSEPDAEHVRRLAKGRWQTSWVRRLVGELDRQVLQGLLREAVRVQDDRLRSGHCHGFGRDCRQQPWPSLPPQNAGRNSGKNSFAYDRRRSQKEILAQINLSNSLKIVAWPVWPEKNRQMSIKFAQNDFTRKW